MDDKSPEKPIEALLALMTRLRDREIGCPWDVAQDFSTIAPYTIEEAYEVADAVAHGDMAALRDELGDLLLQVVFHAEMAREIGAFDFDAVARGITDKMVRRHPHVYGGEAGDASPNPGWETLKAEERAAKAGPSDEAPSTLDGVALALPALMRAQKLQKRAARVGFDWPDIEPALAKVEEELGEVRAAIADGRDTDALAGEVGDLLFACVNVARHLGIDAEVALRGCNDKFVRRFGHVERGLDRAGTDPNEATLETMDALWNEAKARERR